MKHTYVDQSPLVARRLGFSALPLAVLTILIGSQAVSLVLSSSSAHGTSMPRLSNLTNLIWRLSDVEWWKRARESGWEELLQRGRDVDWEAVVRWAKWSTLGLTIWVWCVSFLVVFEEQLLSVCAVRL